MRRGAVLAALGVTVAIACALCSRDEPRAKAAPGRPESGRFLSTPPYAPAPPGVTLDNIAFDGDSLMGEYNDNPPDGGTTRQYQSWAADTCELLGSSVTCHNVATGGISCQALIARAGSFVDALLVPGVTNVVVFQCGINDAATTDGGSGVADIVWQYTRYANARHAAGWNKVVLIGPESNAYWDPQSSVYLGGDRVLSAIDAAAQALYPNVVDAYVALVGDPVLGVVGGGGATGECQLPPTVASSYNSECWYLDARVHKTVNADVYGAHLTAMALIAMPGF